MTDDPVQETQEQRTERALAEWSSQEAGAETPEERLARAGREYVTQGLTARLYNPDDPYNAQDARSGKGDDDDGQ